MKIAFLLPADTLSGGNLVVYEHAKILMNLGHEVAVIFRNWIRVKRDFTTVGGGSVWGEPYWCKKLGYQFDILDWETARDSQFNLVIATWWETAYEIFTLKSEHFAYFVQSDERRFYGAEETLRRIGVEISYKLPLHYLTEARWINRMLADEFNVQSVIIPNGVSSERFYPVEPLEPKNPGKLRVLIEGSSYISYKRVDLAFGVVKEVEDIEVWYVAGDGVCNPDWAPDRFLGSVEPDQMRSIYSSCDVLIKLSVVEGFFLPPLEMMACGGTAIVSDVSGHEEYIRHLENALVVGRDDKEAAVAALRRLRDEPGLLEKLKAAGKVTASEMNWKAAEAAYITLLEKLAKTPTTSPLPGGATGIYLPIIHAFLGKLEGVDRIPESLYLSQREAKKLLDNLDAQFKEVVSYFKLYSRTEELKFEFNSIHQELNEIVGYFQLYMRTTELEPQLLETRSKFRELDERLGVMCSQTELGNLAGAINDINHRLQVIERTLPEIIKRQSLRSIFQRAIKSLFPRRLRRFCQMQ